MVAAQHRVSLVLLAAVACAGETDSATDDASNEVLESETWEEREGLSAPRVSGPDSTSSAKKAPRAPERASFGPGIRGLRLNRSIVVRATPDVEGEKLGTVAAHTIVGWRRAVTAEGCEDRWVEIEPRGWVCGGYLDPVPQDPAGVELPKLRVGETVPGVYGKVIGEDAVLVDIQNGVVVSEAPILGASTVRQRGTTVIGDEVYWKIDGGKFVAASALRPHEPSSFRGVRLPGASALEQAWGFAISSGRPGDWVVVRDGPGGSRVRRLAPRTLVPLLEAEKNAKGETVGYRIGEGEYLAADDIRPVEFQTPPALTEEHERWVDVDLDSQVLVAYEGAEPVYATLVSSGTRKNPTETGIFRIWIKFSETSMSGRMGESDAYSVATVPWTQFYENDFALHTSYWHDRFGQQRSHGCVNLSPRDSRFLYFWSEPQVPPGWSMANASSDRPGSMVRVHSSADPDPEFKGAALKVQNARQARQP